MYREVQERKLGVRNHPDGARRRWNDDDCVVVEDLPNAVAFNNGPAPKRIPEVLVTSIGNIQCRAAGHHVDRERAALPLRETRRPVGEIMEVNNLRGGVEPSGRRRAREGHVRKRRDDIQPTDDVKFEIRDWRGASVPRDMHHV